MNKTINYNLNKPEATDFYNVDDFNANMDAIDTELKLIDDDVTELKADKARFYNFTLTAKKTANIYSSTESSRLPTFMFAVTEVGPNTAIFGSTFNSYPIIASQSNLSGLNITYASTDKKFYVFTNNKVDATTYLFTLLATEELTIDII